MKITIDPHSGCCFGVVSAIKTVETELEKQKTLYCLGEIVHNEMEINRLIKKGLIIIEHEEYFKLKNVRVLIRAHGEPPSTYEYAQKNNIELIDATCPIVLKLQQKIKSGYNEMKLINGQIVIYGKKGHAEVVGLAGQTNNEAIIISKEEDLNQINYQKPVRLYAQTTQNKESYQKLKQIIEDKLDKQNSQPDFKAYQTICGQVSNRTSQLVDFAKKHDVIIFVSGKNSSNGLYLFNLCKSSNERSYFISTPEELNIEMCANAESIGICGATSTPLWLMELVAKKLRQY